MQLRDPNRKYLKNFIVAAELATNMQGKNTKWGKQPTSGMISRAAELQGLHQLLVVFTREGKGIEARKTKAGHFFSAPRTA